MKTGSRTSRLLVSLMVSGWLVIAVPLGAQVITAKLGDVLKNHPCVVADSMLADEVRAKTKGRIDIRVLDNGQLGGSLDMARALSVGAQQFLQESPVFFDEWVPPFAILDTAFVWRDLDHITKTLSGPIGQELNQMLIQKAGVRVLGYTYYGTRHLTANRPIRNLAEMRGLKLRVPNSDISLELARAWGANPVTLNFNELFQGLKSGLVEAQENPLPTIEANRFYTVQKYVMMTGHETNIRGVFVNEAWWQRLAPLDRSIIQTAVDNAVRWCTAEIQKQEASLTEVLTANGMTIVYPNRDELRSVGLKALLAKFEGRWGKGWFERITQYGK